MKTIVVNVNVIKKTVRKKRFLGIPVLLNIPFLWHMLEKDATAIKVVGGLF